MCAQTAMPCTPGSGMRCAPICAVITVYGKRACAERCGEATLPGQLWRQAFIAVVAPSAPRLRIGLRRRILLRSQRRRGVGLSLDARLCAQLPGVPDFLASLRSLVHR